MAAGAHSLLIITILIKISLLSAHRGWDDYHYKKPLPSEIMVDVINNLGLALLEVHNDQNHNNIAISPYGATTVLVALLEGVSGNAAQEIIYVADLPHDYSIIRVGLRDIHRHLKSYFIPKEGFLAGLTLNHENITLNKEYEDILKFYGYDLESFNNPAYPEATTANPKSTTTVGSLPETTTEKEIDPTTLQATTEAVTVTEVITTTLINTQTDSSSDTTKTTLQTDGETKTETMATTLNSVNSDNMEQTTKMNDIVSTVKSITDQMQKITEVKESLETQETATTNSQKTERTTRMDVMSTIITDQITESEPKTSPVSQESADLPTTTKQDIEISTIRSSTQQIYTEYVTNSESLKEVATTIQIPKYEPTVSTITSNEITTSQENPTKFDLLSSMNIDVNQEEDITTTESTITLENMSKTMQITEKIDNFTNENITNNTDTTTSINEVTTGNQANTFMETTTVTEQTITSKNEQTTIGITDRPINNIDEDLLSELQNRPTRDDFIDAPPTDINLDSTEDNQDSATSDDNVRYDYFTSEFPYTTAFSGTDLKMDYYTLSHASVSDDDDYEETSHDFGVTENAVTVTTERSKRESDFFAMISAYIRPELVNVSKKSRNTRSVIDYIIARYYDTYHVNNDRYLPRPHYSNYKPEHPQTFLVNGNVQEPNISFMTYDTVLPFRYIPELDAMALSFPLDSNMYYLLLVLPVEDDAIDKLIYKFRKFTSLRNIIDSLKYTHVKAIIPSFMLKGYVVLTPSLQKLGVRKIFEPRHADFTSLTKDHNIYVTNIEQAVTVTIRNYMEYPNGSGRKLHEFRPVEFRADHPFLYFVMDSQLHVNLMAGKIINPLNSRIR